jgi:hypothetical protein
MSVDYDIFINTEKSYEEVKSSMEKILNCKMEQSPYTEDELYYTTILGLGMGLHKEHTFEGYEGIDFVFSNYQYYINFDYIPSSYLGDYRDEWQITMAVILSDMLSLNLHCECLIVRNMATIIVKFTPDEQIITPHQDCT